MPLYLVEEYVPGLSEQELLRGRDRLTQAAAELSAAGEPIRFVGTTYVPDQETGFSRFEAGSRDLVERSCRRAGIPFARVSEARSLAGTEKEEA